MKILIVDDIKENLMLLRGMLESRGFAVEEAINGVQALDLARAAPPDLIISDIMMPEMDGFTLCRAVKGIEQLRRVPFVFYTATYLNKEDEMLGLALGASRYIHKPVLPKKFLGLIDEVINEYCKGKLQAAESLPGQDVKFEILHQERLVQKLDKKVRDISRMQVQQSLILDSVLEGILAIDLQGKHFIVNNAASHLLGYETDELIGHSSHSLWHHSKADGSLCAAEKCPILLSMINGNRIEQLDDVFWRKDGSSFQVQYSSSPLLESGEIQGVVVVFHDITERKLAEEALRESDDKYRALYDNAPLPYQSLDVEGCCKDVSPCWLATLGYDRQEVIGQSFGDFLSPKSKLLFESRFSTFAKQGFVHDVEFQIRHHDGHYLDITFEGVATYTNDGKFKQTYCVFKDISEQKQSEQALLENEEKFRAVAASALDAIIILDSDGNVRLWNAAAERIFGYKADEVEGRQLAELIIPEQYRDAHIRGMESFKQTGEGSVIGTSLEIEAMRADGSLLPVELSITAMIQGGEHYVVGFVRDITERKKNITQLENQLDELRRWQDATLGREGRSLELKHEVNELLLEMGKALRYPSAEEK